MTTPKKTAKKTQTPKAPSPKLAPTKAETKGKHVPLAQLYRDFLPMLSALDDEFLLLRTQELTSAPGDDGFAVRLYLDTRVGDEEQGLIPVGTITVSPSLGVVTVTYLAHSKSIQLDETDTDATLSEILDFYRGRLVAEESGRHFSHLFDAVLALSSSPMKHKALTAWLSHSRVGNLPAIVQAGVWDHNQRTMPANTVLELVAQLPVPAYVQESFLMQLSNLIDGTD